jgi:hypothetical protein
MVWQNRRREGMEITTFRYELKWLLAVGAHSIGITTVAAAYWNHTGAKWVDFIDEGTVFETEAAAIVYRRGNLQRMTLALKDVSI